jgi:hypothetical protein
MAVWCWRGPSDLRHSLERERGKKMRKVNIGWRGNAKMSFPTWNIPAVSTCPNRTELCEKTCYALKAERQYPDVRPSRCRNFDASRSSDFVSAMVAEISKKSPKIFRIHESGDFYDLPYFMAWAEICRQCPETRFFAFTKVFGLFAHDRPSNFVLIASVFPDTEPGTVPDNVPTFTAVYRKQTGTGQHCSGSCDSCGICPYAENETKVWTELH